MPDVGSDPTPTAMEVDLTATPPRAPQPTALIVNPQTGHIDFSLAGTPIPDDCSTQQALTPGGVPVRSVAADAERLSDGDARVGAGERAAGSGDAHAR